MPPCFLQNLWDVFVRSWFGSARDSTHDESCPFHTRRRCVTKPQRVRLRFACERFSQEQFHSDFQPSAMPIVRALRAVVPEVRNPQQLHLLMHERIVFDEIAVAEQDQTRGIPPE